MVLQDCESAMCGVWVSLRESDLKITFDVLEQLMELSQTVDRVRDFLAETPNPKYEE